MNDHPPAIPPGWTSQAPVQFNSHHGGTSDLERLPEDQSREHPDQGVPGD
jgi:hypothetical protein